MSSCQIRWSVRSWGLASVFSKEGSSSPVSDRGRAARSRRRRPGSTTRSRCPRRVRARAPLLRPRARRPRPRRGLRRRRRLRLGALRPGRLLQRLLEDRVLDQLLLDLLHQLELGHLQELDRLLQRRRHDEPLAHPDAEFLLEGHRGFRLLRGSVQPEVLAEVHPPHLRVGGEIRGRSVPEDATLADNIGAIRDLQSFAHVVIGDQHAQAPVLAARSRRAADPPPRSDRFPRTARRAACSGARWPARARSRPAGARLPRARSPACARRGRSPNSSSSAAARSLRLVGVDALQLEDGQQVLLDRHAAEDRGLLRQVADPAARAQVHGERGDVARRRAGRARRRAGRDPGSGRRRSSCRRRSGRAGPTTSPGAMRDRHAVDDRAAAVASWPGPRRSSPRGDSRSAPPCRRELSAGSLTPWPPASGPRGLGSRPGPARPIPPRACPSPVGSVTPDPSVVPPSAASLRTVAGARSPNSRTQALAGRVLSAIALSRRRRCGFPSRPGLRYSKRHVAGAPRARQPAAVLGERAPRAGRASSQPSA